MEKINKCKVFGGYIKAHLMLLLVLSICSGLFMLIFFLYGIPLETYGYAFILSGAVGLLFGIWDYLKYWKRHLELYGLYNKITVEYNENFCKPTNLIEKDYQEILKKLFDFTASMEIKNELNRKEMVDYYTLWAHQIKTPITALNLLIQVESRPQNAGLLQQMLKIERYVDMVLHYLRMENMSSDLKLQEYNVLQLVQKAVKQDSSVFIYRKISLNLEEMEDIVITDEKWIVFVIEQILSNALKYTNEGSISIYMDKEERETLVIEDTGIGIQEEDLPRIFENGFTGYNGRMEKKSTGIGLFLCKQILDRLGHAISVRSTVGSGTQIRINLYRDKLETE